MDSPQFRQDMNLVHCSNENNKPLNTCVIFAEQTIGDPLGSPTVG